ncbi:MAG: DUF4340 domain-containing protein [Desulfatiglandales bacterium]
MTYRSTFIYLLVVILFLGFYLFETRREKKQEHAEEATKTLFPFQPEELTRIAFLKDDREIVVEKSDGEWEITAPLHAPIDPFALSRVKNTLGVLQYLRIISKDPEDLSEFGLDPPSFVLSYRAGDEEDSLAFGHKSPVEDGFYARKGTGKTVYLIWRPDKDDLEKTLLDLRNKGLFTIGSDQVERLVIERSGRPWTLHRIEGKWLLLGHENVPINQEKIDHILSITLTAEALSFVQEEADDLAPYGLDSPEARVVVSGDDRTEEILYGAHSEESAVYAMIGGKPQVLKVPKRLLVDLPETMEDLKTYEKRKPEP